MTWWDVIKAATRNDWRNIQALGFLGWLRMTWGDWQAGRAAIREGSMTGEDIVRRVIECDAAGGPVAEREAERLAEEQRVERLRRLYP